MEKQGFIAIISQDDQPRVYREDGEPVVSATREDAWDYVRDNLSAGLFKEQAENCECEDGHELCPPCELDAHLGAFISQEIVRGNGDVEFVSEFLLNQFVRVEVQPLHHYHVYRSDLENGTGNPIPMTEDMLQCVSGELEMVAEELSQRAAACGYEGDELASYNQSPDQSHAQAWRFSVEAERFDVLSRLFDLHTRRTAPLFQGDGGPAAWTNTLKHLMGDTLGMEPGCQGGVIQARQGTYAVCALRCTRPECWEEQEF